MTSVFITGASSGLGRGLAEHYAKEGWRVVAAARRREELEKLAGVTPLVLDVRDTDKLVAAVQAEDFDLVIANAGIGAPGSARKMDWHKVRDIFEVNTTACCVTIAAALPKMVARNSGHVVAVSSLAAFRGMPGHAAYCASKAAVHTFMESVRVDLRGSKVRATCIYPGFVKTEMTAKNKFRMPFLMELDDAVKVMTRGIARGAKTISYPLPTVAGARLLGALPSALYEPLAGRSRT